MTRETVRLVRRVARPLSYEQYPSHAIHLETIDVIVEWPGESLRDKCVPGQVAWNEPWIMESTASKVGGRR